MLTLLIAATIIITAGAAFLDYRAYSSLTRLALILASGALLIGFILEHDRTVDESGPIILITDGASDADLLSTSEATVYSVESGDGENSGNEI